MQRHTGPRSKQSAGVDFQNSNNATAIHDVSIATRIAQGDPPPTGRVRKP